MNNQNRNVLFWATVFIVLVVAFNLLQGESFITSQQQLHLSDFLARVDAKQVSRVKIQGHSLEGELTDGSSFSTYFGNYDNLVNRLNDNGVHIEVLPTSTRMGAFISTIISWFPMLLFIGVWIFVMRQMQSGSSKALYFGRSKAKLMAENSVKVSFKDVAGIEEAKDELMEIVDFLRDPGKFQKLGGKIPKGCLLIGPPGTGKTLLAKAIAGEANVPFFHISGSNFVEMFVGVGASRVRDMFEQAKKNAPCIVFIDEIDAVGRHRGIGLGGGNDEREQTLNQILVEMDGFESNEGVIVVAATNRADVLDQALLRPGRFDRKIVLINPDVKGREKILNVHLQKVKHAADINIKAIACGTFGLSGAALANIVNESALIAAKNNKKEISNEDLEQAKDKIMMGSERRSMALTDEQKRCTAYHEAGHAIVALYVKASDPIHKVTIVPRGSSLGMVMRLPKHDRLNYTKEQLESNITVALGGRIAEEVIFGKDKVTTGAAEDIKQCTKIARFMVLEAGLSDKVGLQEYTSYYESSSYPNQRGKLAFMSEKNAQIIEDEVTRLINAGYKLAREIITSHLDKLKLIANSLLDKETLNGDDVKLLVFGEQKTKVKKKNTQSKINVASEKNEEAAAG
ncbi:ATP-dependent zinc metalloprotease FtsH [Orientia tsutsugamushi]|uniref:ATP-dependent zinc metalloprotease FtsH n=1 Tax=Orientia tsutsugamushi (strain Boryong) TaxID=357244 RepID=A5CFP3_ORITB|nr:ATP-dependent zinc metalloprotease FtsH [Orientia tsutsugamushi]CAM81263.1 ATP-dependent metalloprotease [Orientia tsutsugamushi str. Boryong]